MSNNKHSNTLINRLSMDEPRKMMSSLKIQADLSLHQDQLDSSTKQGTASKLTEEYPTSSKISNNHQPVLLKSNKSSRQDRPKSLKEQSTTTTTDNLSADCQLLECDLKSLFECPVCSDYAIPPISQCQNGHLICQACRKKIDSCPTCRVSITDPLIRNLQLDRLANTFQFPCKYNFNGCQWKSYWFMKHDHEDGCPFTSYKCPCPGTPCKWSGLSKDIMQHLNEHHQSITTLRGEDIVFLATDINLTGAVDWVMIQSCFNNHFLLVLEKQELKSGSQQFFAIVQLISTSKEARGFRYKLELISNSRGGQTKKLQWEATPRSVSEGIQDAIANHDCLVFDTKTARHFLSPIHNNNTEHDNTSCNHQEGENLAINVTITRCESEAETTSNICIAPNQLELTKLSL